MTAESRTVSVGQKKAALSAVLLSETLARSEQLRAFLRFVCDKEIDGTPSQITEYEIGVQALGRPVSYSPADDSSVRTRAYELRHRLQRYYSEENPGAPLRIELPKGTYTPRFVAAAEIVEPRVLPPEPTPVRNPWKSWPLIFLAGVLAAGIPAVILIARSATAKPETSIRTAWTAIAAKDPEVLICLGAPLHYLVAPAGENLAGLPAPEEAYQLFSRYRPLPKDAKLQMQPVQKAMTMGNVQGMARVIGVLGTFGAQYRLLPETNSPLPAMRRRSVVLFGSPWYSRAAATLLANTPWTLGPDDVTHEIGLLGTGKITGMKYLPRHGPRGEYQEVFGLVSVLPSDPGTDDGHTIVVFSGLTSAGTHGAAAFFTSATDLARLGKHFQSEGLTRWPRSYQVVVRCRTSEDTQLLAYTYETHQVIEK